MTSAKKVGLAPGVMVESLGDTLMVHTPGATEVLMLSGEVADLVRAIDSGQLPAANDAVIDELVQRGILATSGHVTRRSVVRAGLVGAGAGIAVVVLPGVAAASTGEVITPQPTTTSPPVTSEDGQDDGADTDDGANPILTAEGTWQFIDDEEIDIFIDLSEHIDKLNVGDASDWEETAQSWTLTALGTTFNLADDSDTDQGGTPKPGVDEDGRLSIKDLEVAGTGWGDLRASLCTFSGSSFVFPDSDFIVEAELSDGTTTIVVTITYPSADRIGFCD